MKTVILAILFLPFFASAQLRLAKVLSDNMVLQRNKPIHIWGKGTPGQNIILSFANENKTVVVQADSSWSIYFKKQKANVRAQSIFIKSGSENIELEKYINR
jgi:sialate O-acetylesterase